MTITAEDIKNADPKRCWVDGVKNISDQHHIIPVEFGGPEDGLTVPLCPTCHRNIHREAEHRFKAQETGEFVNTENYPNKQHYQRAVLLAAYVLKAKIRFIETGQEKADSARNMVQVSFLTEELAMAHTIKRSLGMRSLERTIKLLVVEKYKELQGRGK